MAVDTYLDPEAFTPEPDTHRRSMVLLWLCAIALLTIGASQITYVRGVWYSLFYRTEPASVSWQTSFVDALTESDRSHKPILIYFASPSAYCHAMAQEVWCDPRLRPLVASRFVPLRLDLESAQDLAHEYHVDHTPTILVIDGKDERFRTTGFIAAYDLTFKLQRALEPMALTSH